jgi:hypothetical protein
MLKLKPPITPTEALSVDEIPKGKDWQYEPKWDGFRCLAFRDDEDVSGSAMSDCGLARSARDDLRLFADSSGDDDRLHQRGVAPDPLGDGLAREPKSLSAVGVGIDRAFLFPKRAAFRAVTCADHTCRRPAAAGRAPCGTEGR